MSIAEKIAEGKQKPPEVVSKGVEDVLAVAQAVSDSIDEALLSREFVRQHRATSNGQMTVEQAEEAAEKTAAENRESGTYAYKFLEMEDGSALAIFVTRHGEEAQMKAFPSMAHTRFFHPVRNVSGEE